MNQKYHVVACFARRRQQEAVKAEYEAKYPSGYWWLTAECHYEFRIPKEV